MKRCAALVLLISLFVAVPTSANEARRRDPNDTRGPLDIKYIAHGHASGKLLWHKVAMRSPWGKRALRGGNDITFGLSNDGEDRFDEVHVTVDVADGKLGAWIYGYIEGSDYAGVGESKPIKFTRPNRMTIKIFFDQSWVDRRDRYAWDLWTSYRKRGSRHCQNWCSDHAPGSSPDRLVHKL